ncbi:hypothetical protein JCGZ_07863 [Jatropha curcas]|uniref:Aminotransferase-like plant mobile domain-containing protein n=1 Tax=Jatropha curcas TaxID=180498 RepID=A0A067KWK6_JATCU|nr:hypothetical protein JCGZ_07863 [Jatropha curcas]
MSQLFEIPASTYTPEMETLGVIPDIPTFDGEPVPVSRNPLTSGTRPLQLLPLPGVEFPVRYETSQLRGFRAESVHASAVAPRSCVTQLFYEEQLHDATVRQGGEALSSRVTQLLRCVAQLWRCVAHLFLGCQTLNSCVTQLWGCVAQVLRCVAHLFLRVRNLGKLRDAALWTRDVDLGKARSGGSSTDTSAFWDLLDPHMRDRVIAAGFGDYAAGLHRTQPRFSPAMRYTLMERWNDCTHTFVFGFGEMTLTPVDYAAITGLRFTGPVAPLDARYQTATLGAQLVRTLLGVTTQTRYTAQGCVSYEVVYRFWAERIRNRLAAWRELPMEARPAAPAYTREERDQVARSFLFYIISFQLLCTSQNKGDPAVLACLRDLSQVGSFDWATLALAHLYHGLDVWIRGTVWAYEYRIYPGGPSGDTPAESKRIPQYLAHCHHTYASTEDPEYWRSFLNDRELSDAWRTYSGREVAELHTRSRLLMRGYWADRYYLGERVYDTPVAPAQRRVPHAPPRHMCMLEGMTTKEREVEYRGFSANDFLSAGDFPTYFSSRMQARLPEVLKYTQERKTHKMAAHYRAEATAEAGAAAAPTGPVRIIPGDVPFPPGMEVVLDPDLGVGSGITIPADLRRAPPLPQLDPAHATHVPAQRYLEICQRFGFARFYIAQLYSEHHEMDLEIGRLRRHQSRQCSAVSRLQAEVDRLRTRLEVEGIPLDSSEEDDDGSSSDDAPPSPPPQATAGPSRRHR